jgi:aldose 1-epimerase
MTSVVPAMTGTQWAIEADGHRAVVVEVGGALRHYSVGDVPVLDGFEADELSPASAGQILAPWPNRIRDGYYEFEGQGHQLPLTEPARHNAIHGLANWARWSLVEQAADAVTVEYELPAQMGYPWWLTLRSRWQVSSAGLSCTQEVVNNSPGNAPWGFSVHPYLQLPGVAVDDILLHVPGKTRIQPDNRLLPIGYVPVTGTEFDFTEPRAIGDLIMDVSFGDIEHDANGITEVTIADPGSDRKVVVWADDKFKYWQIFTGDTLTDDRFRRSVAIEPMTCPPDSFRTGRDLIVLAPGETWRASWGIRS